ncbi:hypothetical protein [Methanocalculus sp.]|uniref:hypothetical protein n=1 Tax=Methanocalculus sp. TaxID=2004547 RepID=UPI00271FAEE4|nr:hypothetical protein [Methanocalculus sp.]MDO8841268.1 hypothetical protein [Methanocalculus sp.]
MTRSPLSSDSPADRPLMEHDCGVVKVTENAANAAKFTESGKECVPIMLSTKKVRGDVQAVCL